MILDRIIHRVYSLYPCIVIKGYGNVVRIVVR